MCRQLWRQPLVMLGLLAVCHAWVPVVRHLPAASNKSAARGPTPRITPLFIPGSDGGPLSYPCFRQPELTLVGGDGLPYHILLAWTEAYPASTPGPTGSCAPPMEPVQPGDLGSGLRLGLGDHADLIYRRSTDSGNSWGKVQRALGNRTSVGQIDWCHLPHFVCLKLIAHMMAVMRLN